MSQLRRYLLTAGLGTLLCAATSPAFAEDLVITVEPPAPKTEAVPAAPGPDFVWSPGHWQWNGKGHEWVAGEYIHRSHPNAEYIPGHWDHRHHGWVWEEGYWSEGPPPAAAAEPPPPPAPAAEQVEVVAEQPPALRVEVVPPSPGVEFVWRPGFWRWSGHEHVWIGGEYMHRVHPDAAWVPGHWDRHHHGWVWIEGHWNAR